MGGFELFGNPGGRATDLDMTLAAGLNELLDKEVRARRLELKEDYDSLLEPALEKLLVGMGLQKLFFEESLGGEGHSGPEAAFTAAAALEQIGWADTGLGFLAAHSFALQAVLASGGRAEAPRKRFAPLFCGGEKPVTVSFVLPGHAERDGPAWYGRYLQVTARRDGSDLVLDADSARPTGAGFDAGLFGVLCSVEGEVPPAFVLVPRDSPGLARGSEFKKTGLAASRNADVAFNGVRVPEDGVVSTDDAGVMRLLAWFYMSLAAVGSGSLVACYEILKEWGDTRVIKGRGSIFKENPLTAALMGKVAGDAVVCRALTYWVAETLAAGIPPDGGAAAGAWVAALIGAQRVFGTAEVSVHNIMELMASAGYASEWQLERYWRDLKTVQCYLGSTELANIDVARRFYECRTL